MPWGRGGYVALIGRCGELLQTYKYKTGTGGAHFVRQNCDCDLNCAYLFGRRQGISVRTNITQEKMSSAALPRILFWPRLGPLGRVFLFESRLAADRLPQAVRSPLWKHMKEGVVHLASVKGEMGFL